MYVLPTCVCLNQLSAAVAEGCMFIARHISFVLLVTCELNRSTCLAVYLLLFCIGQAWKSRVGDQVVVGQVLGEIVDVVDVDAPRVPVVSRAAGVVFGMRNQRLVKPGDIIIKVAGSDPLPWRVGNLLTA